MSCRFGSRCGAGFTYPVAIYDHNEGQVVSGGFAYYGRIVALRGKFVFGDIQVPRGVERRGGKP